MVGLKLDSSSAGDCFGCAEGKGGGEREEERPANEAESSWVEGRDHKHADHRPTFFRFYFSRLQAVFVKNESTGSKLD